MIDRNAENSSTHANPDLVSDLLMGMRLYGLEYNRTQVSPPFGLRFPAIEGRAQFHFVGRGPVYLRGPGEALHALDTGDAVLLPRGGEHSLVSDPKLKCQCITEFQPKALCRDVSEIMARPNERDQSPDVLIFSGCMEFDLGSMHPLVALMPDVMQVNTLLERYPEILPILDAMEREANEDRAGFAGILARLADVVSAFIVRAWVECGCGGTRGWVAALRDPRLGRVIAALHRDPGRDWTVAELAAQMGSSRSVFADRFQAVTGMTPVRYLTELRMRLAAQWISREGMPIETAAQRLGYGSQAAFSRAFKRIIGKPPGAVRVAQPRSRPAATGHHPSAPASKAL
ncbi:MULTISPECIES: AraC family transcriptional regulator [unclassified Nitratireductor]|uniref:AraC family transcriptional regulator n=1 Tax=unclassified Nitratireductor TaxID=2641084 RepID=UPI0025FBC674|nr:AraC family transcriptional regulator [Nitratireductor sp.]